MITTGSGYYFTIKNDEQGQIVVKRLREIFKIGKKRVVLRGRGHRHGIYRYRQSLPLSLASHWAIYLK